MDEDSEEKMVTTLFNKVPGKKEILYILFWLKKPAQICVSNNYIVYFKLLQCCMLIITQ